MMVSKHFSRSEFKCKCGACNYDTVDAELLEVLEDLRANFDKPVTLTSAHRCPTHNKSVGGSDNSYHILGRAADVQIKDVKPISVQIYLESAYPNQYGIGRYGNFTHIDTRTSKGRWNG